MDRDLSQRNPFQSPHGSHHGEASTSFHNQEEERPNRVMSMNRKFARTFYTGASINFENHADNIVAKMEEHEDLMKDTPLAEEMRKEALRELPQCLTMKRVVKKKLTKSVSQKSRGRAVNFKKSLGYKMTLLWARFKNAFEHFNFFELWHGTMKDIEGRFGSGYASYFKFLRWVFVLNVFVAILVFALLAVPQIIHDASGSNNISTDPGTFSFEDIFVGKGYFEATILYYGHYTNLTISTLPYLYFDMPAAYFSVNIIIYFLAFFILGASVARFYNRTFIETQGGLQNVYASKIFSGWDYGIASKKAAVLKSSTIYNEIKELLSESYRDSWDGTCCEKFWTFCIQFVINVLVLVLLAGIGWGTWLLLEEFSPKTDASVLVPTVVINIVIMVLPPIFSVISKYENYRNPRTALYITLTRTYLLGSVFIGAIVTYWLSKVDNGDNIDCWENFIGAEIYRLILFDFIFSVLLSTVLEISLFLIRRTQGIKSKPEFNVASHTLQIIYNQGLFWVGLLYSPLIPAMITIKMLVIWYIREWCVRKFCSPPRKTWRAAQAQTWFTLLIFVSVLLILAVHGYTMKSIHTSECGPFQNYDFMYQILTSNLQSLQEDHIVWKVLLYITRPGVIAFAIIILGLIVYYWKEKSNAEKERVKMLREMLVWMAKDKKVLVQWYIEVTKGSFNHSLRDERFMDPRQVLPHEFSTEGNYGSLSTVSSSVTADDELNARFKKFA